MQAEEALSPPGEGPLLPATPAVLVYQGALLVGAYPLSQAGLTIGKAPSNNLVLSDTHVSRYHARIVGEAGCWQVEDLGSTNGTFVYERDRLVSSSLLQAEPWVLHDQQEIRLGPHPLEWRLVFSDPTATDKSPPVYIDAEHRQVWVRSLLVRLPRDQYTVLLALYERAPAPCPYEALCAALDQDHQTRKRRPYSELVASEIDSLQHLIHRLRARIEVDPKDPQLLLQVPHVGYRLHNVGRPLTQHVLGNPPKGASE
jgi:pSer/pThr/pTyr-binding forkhead associated (FHA) protein